MSNPQDTQILTQLSRIIDPDLGKDIVTLGFIHNLQIQGGAVSLRIELTTPACPVKDMFQREAETAIRELPWVTDVAIEMGASKKTAGIEAKQNGLVHVRHIIAVSSCKGGVGKSTVAVNLAFSLAQQGAEVGIFDADVYGPSLPVMVKINPQPIQFKKDLLMPVVQNGVKLMSFGYVQDPDNPGPAMMRGPMVSQVINQLLTGTDWGHLDYLILDLPPGTGDIQLTLAQLVPITAAVIVTTPQYVSFIDVEKGIQMFGSLKIPAIAVVENMSYFVCDNCDKKHYLFGANNVTEKLKRQFGIAASFEVPLMPQISEGADEGLPISVILDGKSDSNPFWALSQSVVREVAKITHEGKALVNVESCDEGRLIRITRDGESIGTVSAKTLRAGCQCAHCINEWTQEVMVDAAAIPDTLTALEPPKPVGNYAWFLKWSDGHDSLIPTDTILNQLAIPTQRQ